MWFPLFAVVCMKQGPSWLVIFPNTCMNLCTCRAANYEVDLYTHHLLISSYIACQALLDVNYRAGPQHCPRRRIRDTPTTKACICAFSREWSHYQKRALSIIWHQQWKITRPALSWLTSQQHDVTSSLRCPITVHRRRRRCPTIITRRYREYHARRHLPDILPLCTLMLVAPSIPHHWKHSLGKCNYFLFRAIASHKVTYSMFHTRRSFSGYRPTLYLHVFVTFWSRTFFFRQRKVNWMRALTNMAPCRQYVLQCD